MSVHGTDSPIVKQRTKPLILLEVLALWHTSLHTDEIAKKLRVSVNVLTDFSRRNKLPKRTHVPRRSKSKIVDPTPEEIAERAAEVRAMRTASEHARLTDYKQRPVEVRQYAYSSRTGIFTEM